MATGSFEQPSGGTMRARTPRAYPTTPPPLSRGDIAEFAARRRAASRVLQEAQAHRQFEGQRIEAGFEQFTKRLEREAGRREHDMRSELAGRGMALQPRGVGVGLRKVRDWQADTLSEEQHSKAERLAALEEAVRQARSLRDEEHAAVGADEARRRTELDRLIRSVGV